MAATFDLPLKIRKQDGHAAIQAPESALAASVHGHLQWPPCTRSPQGVDRASPLPVTDSVLGEAPEFAFLTNKHMC